MRQAQRQAAQGETVGGRHLFAPYAVAAFAVENFAGRQVALGRRHHVGAETAGTSGGLAPQRDGGHRNSELEADQVGRAVHRRIFGRFVVQQIVFLETVRDVLVVGFEHHVDAHLQVVLDLRAVAMKAGNHFGGAGVTERAAGRFGDQHVGQVVTGDRREVEAVRLRRQAGGVADGGHFNRRLGAVHKARAHLRVHVAALGDLGRNEIILEHRIGGLLVEVGEVARALAGRDDLEAAGPRPVDLFADQRRLIAVGQRIDHAGLFGPAGEQGAGQGVGFDVDHDDVLAGIDAEKRVADAGGGIAGGVDDDLDAAGRDHRRGVVADVGAAAPQGLGDRGCGVLFGAPAGGGQVGAGVVGAQVGDGDDLQARG